MVQSELPLPPYKKQIEQDGVALYHTPAQEDAGVTAVMVHGGSHAAWCFRGMAEHFAAHGINVVGFDWRNHGQSERLPESDAIRRTMADVAQDELPIAVQYAREQHPRPLVLVGHSMGGLVVQKYLEDNSVHGAVLLASCAPREVGNTFMPLPLNMSRLFMPSKSFQRWAFFQNFPEKERHIYSQHLTPESPAAIELIARGRRRGVSVDADRVREHIGANRMLVLSDGRDILASRKIQRRIAAYHGATYLKTNIRGHCNLIYGPDWKVAADSVIEWIKRLPMTEAA